MKGFIDKVDAQRLTEKRDGCYYVSKMQLTMNHRRCFIFIDTDFRRLLEAVKSGAIEIDAIVPPPEKQLRNGRLL